MHPHWLHVFITSEEVERFCPKCGSATGDYEYHGCGERTFGPGEQPWYWAAREFFRRHRWRRINFVSRAPKPDFPESYYREIIAASGYGWERANLAAAVAREGPPDAYFAELAWVFATQDGSGQEDVADVLGLQEIPAEEPCQDVFYDAVEDRDELSSSVLAVVESWMDGSTSADASMRLLADLIGEPPRPAAGDGIVLAPIPEFTLPGPGIRREFSAFHHSIDQWAEYGITGVHSYLEVGAFEGASLAGVELHHAEAPWSATVIDPTIGTPHMPPTGPALRQSLADCSASTLFYNTYSQDVLPHLLKEGNTYDLVYIDGSHHHPDVAVDAHYACQLVKVGGWVIFDDYRDWRQQADGGRTDWLRPTIDHIIDGWREHFDHISGGRPDQSQLVLRRVPRDTGNGASSRPGPS